MAKMVKIIMSFLLIMISFLVFASCSFQSINTDIEQREIANKIMEYLNNGDFESLKNLFCQDSLDLPNLDEQIIEAINYFKDRIVSFDELKRAATDGRSIRDGEIVRIRTSARIENILIDDGQIYSIVFHNYLIYNDYKNLEGISVIWIESDDLEFKIGELLDYGA